MKKVLALVLSLMMILCSVSALATEVTADSIVNGTGEYQNKIDVRSSVSYNDAAGNDISGQAATELWLQVEASGQIDVTVPLVLVFQTNIDGGAATSPETYKITNHSSADLVVTKIAVKDVKAADNTPSMEKVAWAEKPTEDQYKAKLTVAKATMGKNYANQRDFDLKTTEYTGERHEGGIFELAKAAKNGAGTDTAIALSMETGKLSFVTSRKVTNTVDSNGQLNDELDNTKGIQLLTITYTVAIDTSDAYGEEITTSTTAKEAGNVLSGADDTTTHTKVQPRVTSKAAKDNADK